MHKNVAFIPVRGGSKSIKDKNIKMIGNKPLVHWSIEAAVNCKNIDKVFVATDSEKIKEVALNYSGENAHKLEVITRSEETATDTASTESAMLEFSKNYEFENIVLIQATSPLIEANQINEGFELIKNGFDSCLSAVVQKRFYWEEDEQGVAKATNYNPLKRPRRQEFSGNLVENGAFYITSKKLLEETKCRISGKIGIVKMDEQAYFEIDEPSDWIIIDKFLNEKANKKSSLDKIKAVFTDSDGVLTDGGMYIFENGDECKKFNAKDGMGFKLLRENGYITGIITGEKRELIKTRGEKLKVNELFMGIENKKEVILELCKKYDLKLEEIAFIGDDINDICALEIVGFSATTADAIALVQEKCNFVTTRTGGMGAFREFADVILKSKITNS